MLLNKRKKPGLKFNPGSALISLRTTGSWTKVLGTVMQYSLLSLIIVCPQNTVENTLQFVLSPLYKKLNLGKNSGYKRPTLFVGWGGGVGHV